MSENGSIETTITPIGAFIKNMTSLEVPHYQRDYAWTDEQVDQFLQDLDESIQEERSSYFLGPMVMKETPNNSYEIIDGQQRLTTVFLILSALRRIFTEQGDSQRADCLKEFFGVQDIRTMRINSKFNMNENNKLDFDSYIVDTDSSLDELQDKLNSLIAKDTKKLLLGAYLQIYDSMKKLLIKGENFSSEKAFDYIEYIQTKLKVLIITVNDELNAYLIFETLNDRGLGLKPMELLRNYVFSKSGSKLDSIKAYWRDVRSYLNDIDPKEMFLQHFWYATQGKISKHKLFDSYRQSVKNSLQAYDFSKELKEIAEIYNAIYKPDSLYWNRFSSDKTAICTNLKVIHAMEAHHAIPILIAATKELSGAELKKLTNTIISMAFRYNVICEKRATPLTDIYHNFPKEVYSGKIKKAAKFVKKLEKIYPTDEEFKASFAIKSVTTTKKARIILSVIENSLHDTVSVNIDPEQVNVEHIFPKNPSSDNWGTLINELGEEKNEYIWRLGNLALTKSADNKKAGTKKFTEKKSLIFSKENDLKTTLMLNEYNEWTKKCIDEHQLKLGEFACAATKIEFN